MFVVIGIMFAGIGLGFLLRRIVLLQRISAPISWTIWLLLFFLGITVGGNEEVISHLGSLGGSALLIAVSGTAGSVLMAALVWRLAFRKEAEKPVGEKSDETKEENGKVNLMGSLTVVCFFVAGCLLGWSGWFPDNWDGNLVSQYVLYLLMLEVGLSIGSDRKLKQILCNLRPKILLVPLATMVGTLTFSALASFFLSRWNVTECLAVGSGFGYYSLSSILITRFMEAPLGVQMAAELGTIALLANIIREIMALLGGPFFARYFGPLAPICAGGATTMDTTLPIITQCSGKDKVFISIIHGIIMDFSVPFFVSFFCSLQ